MEMHLAKNIYDAPEKVPSRFGYGYGLIDLGKKNKNVVVLGADLTSSLKVDMFQKEFPDRFIEIGISEQDMMCVAAGLSLVGKIPFVSTYGIFSTGRAWDQLRTTVCYANLNVKIGSGHAGISVGPDGATHQTLEDIGVTRVIPNTSIISGCDWLEVKKATLAAAEIKGPVILRFGREKVPVITTEKTPFKVGRAETFRDGKDITIIATGHMVYEAMIAAKELEKEKIDARVINLHTIKPIDEKTIIKAAKETKGIVTAEEHQIMCGMGSAVAEVIVRKHPTKMHFIGINDTFGESGEPEELTEAYGLTSKNIINSVKEILKG